MGTVRVAGTAWGMGRALCLHSVTRDSLKGVRSGVLLCNSQGQIFPIQAIMGGGARAGDTQGHCRAVAPHDSVFFRKKKKKTLAVNINYISWRKNVHFPHACLFISPGSTGSHCCGDPGLPLALASVCVPQLCIKLAQPTVTFCLGTKHLSSVTNGFGCSTLVSGLVVSYSLPPSLPLHPTSLVFSSLIFRSLTQYIFESPSSWAELSLFLHWY